MSALITTTNVKVSSPLNIPSQKPSTCNGFQDHSPPPMAIDDVAKIGENAKEIIITSSTLTEEGCRTGENEKNRESSLRRFVESDMFNVHFAIHYLFKNREPGVQIYLAQRLHSFPTEEVDFYLPQLVTLLLKFPDSSKYLSGYFSQRILSNRMVRSREHRTDYYSDIHSTENATEQMYSVNSSLRFATQLSWLLYTIDGGSTAAKTPVLLNPPLPPIIPPPNVLQSTVLPDRRRTSEPQLNHNDTNGDSDNGSLSGSCDDLATNSPSSSSILPPQLQTVTFVDKVFSLSSRSCNEIGSSNSGDGKVPLCFAAILSHQHQPPRRSATMMGYVRWAPSDTSSEENSGDRPSLAAGMDNQDTQLPATVLPPLLLSSSRHLLFKHKRTASDLTNVISSNANQFADLDLSHQLSDCSPGNEEVANSLGQNKFAITASMSARSRYWVNMHCHEINNLATRSDTHLLATTIRAGKTHRPSPRFSIDLLGCSPADVGEPLDSLKCHLAGFLDSVPSHQCTPLLDLCLTQWDFILALLSISRRLTSFACKEQRTGHLQAELAKVNLGLPARVWLPVERTEHIVLRIPPSAAVCLNSAEKSPYLIFVEVLVCENVVQTRLPKRIGTYSGLAPSNMRFHDNTTQYNQSVQLLNPAAKLSIGGAKAIAAPDVISLFSVDSGSGSTEEFMSPCCIKPISGSTSPPSITPDDDDDDDDVSSESELNTPMATPVDHDHLMFHKKQLMKEKKVVFIKAVEIRRRLTENAACKPPSSFKLDPEDPSAAVLKEPWELKARRIKESSPWSHLPGWKLAACIIKVGDDLRQEQLAYQLLNVLQRIWAEDKVDLWLRPLNIVITSLDSGLIELVVDTVSLHQIRRHAKLSLRDYIIREHGPTNSEGFLSAQRNFVQSCAAYCIVGYLFQVKDRHNGNILIDRDGHVIHIDYGFMLSTSPGKNLGFETSPFKLTAEQVELMGGVDSDMFRYYKSLILRGLLATKKHRDEICLLVEIARLEYPHLPCFGRGDGASIVEALRNRFLQYRTEDFIQSFVSNIVDASLNSLTTRLYDSYQYYTNGIQ